MTETTEPGGDRYRVDHESLAEFVERTLEAAGVASDHAHIITDALVQANLRGIGSHGVARLEVYLRKFEAGGFNPEPEIDVRRTGEAVLFVDGDDGPGQSVGLRAVDAAMEVADDTGMAFAFVTNSNHFGTAAYYTQTAARENYIGLAMTNVGPDVAPFGGMEPTLGTNPISFSVPTDREFPITLDMATSAAAMGKIDHVAAEEDTEIPPDWALGESGQPTTDPHAVSALRPAAGPKGYGLAIMVDVLSGLLTETNPSYEVGPLYSSFDQPMGLGHCIGVINIDALRDVTAFKADMGAYIDRLKAVEAREGFEEVKLPGEIEAERRRENEGEGVPLRLSTVESLRQVAERYDVPLPVPLRS
jgi:ureidoglycolate dehydrogenase (NAD+)